MRKSPFALVGLAALVAALTAAQAPQPQSPSTQAPSPVGELLPDEQIQQVLNRLTFGARPGDADKVRAMGIDKWIDLQLHPERIPDPNVDALTSRYPVYSMASADIIRDYNVVQQIQREVKKEDATDSTMTKGEARRDILREDPKKAELVKKTQQFVGQIQSAQLARAVTTDRQLDEVMVDFWENHFSVFAGKGQTRLFLAQYDRDVIRPHALGKFRDLLGAVAHSPAMLFFLDNFQSVADSAHPTLAQANNRRPGALRGGFGGGGIGMRRPGMIGVGGFTPAQQRRIDNATPEQREKIEQQLQARAKRGVNENYARELMELHTLGVDGGYTQKDVQEVARALTGWSFNRQNGEFVFNANAHDAGEKLILGQKFPAGHGEDEGERVLDIVARAPATAKFITTKLARHFVSDDPPPALVDRCSSTFSKTDGDIRETLKCIIRSPEFFSREAYRAKVKTPFELVASALRAVNAQPDTTPRSAQIVARLGQPIFGRQTPDGWPDKGEAWMNTGAILNRINFGLSLAGGQVPGAKLQNLPDFDALRSEPRPQQVDAVVKSMLGGQVSQVTRDVLMSGTNPMLAKTGTVATDMTSDDSTSMSAANRPARGGTGPKGTGGLGLGKGQLPAAPTRPINLQGFPQVVGLALGAPEFQRR